MYSKQIVLTSVLLLVTIILFGMCDLDFIIQDYFYNTTTHQWLLDKHTQPYAFIFYSGIKKLLIGIAVILLLVYFIFRNDPRMQAYKKGLLIVIFSSILIPLIIGGLKKSTNMPCPKHLIHYEGAYPTTAVWERYTPEYHALKHIQCWPAGHASGGFALMSLFFLFRRKGTRYLALGGSLIVGWSMGIYKMLIGDHFFSHTFITMLVAWIIILLIHGAIEYISQRD